MTSDLRLHARNTLSVLWANLPEKDHAFVQSLLAWPEAKLTVKQWYWIEKMSVRAQKAHDKAANRPCRRAAPPPQPYLPLTEEDLDRQLYQDRPSRDPGYTLGLLKGISG